MSAHIVTALHLVRRLALRPAERVLWLGPTSAAGWQLATDLVGPAGQVLHADHPPGAGALPHADGEFDAVLAQLTAADPAHRLRVLAEITRVTAPTGRVTFAVPTRADHDPAPGYALATQAGLRGVIVESPADTGPGQEPILMVTAFPPRPATGRAGVPRSDHTAEIPAVAPAGRWPGRVVAAGLAARRHRVVVAAAVVTVLAIAAGVAWGLAGPGDPPQAAGLAATDPAPGGPVGSAEPTGQPTDGAGTEPAPGPGDATGVGSGSGDGGSGRTGGGGEGPKNRPPVIESPGLSSEGLVLRVRPKVTDPEGDDVTLRYEVDGDAVPTMDPARAEVRFDPAEVGHRHEASVVIVAADSHGATTRETFTHVVLSKSTVTLRDLQFRVASPRDCFRDEPSRGLVVPLQFSGAKNQQLTATRTLTRDRSSVLLLAELTGLVAGEEPVLTVALVDATFAGRSASVTRVHRQNINQGFQAFSGPCRGTFSYTVTIDTG